MNIKYKVKKQSPTTHHIALNEELTLYKTLNEEQKKTIVELEAKAQAFDVLKSKADFKAECGAFGYEITMGAYVAPLTQEQYEILKKVGVE